VNSSFYFLYIYIPYGLINSL